MTEDKAKRKEANYEYILSCYDCGEMIMTSYNKSFLTPKGQRWKDHVEKDCMNGEYND